MFAKEVDGLEDEDAGASLLRSEEAEEEEEAEEADAARGYPRGAIQLTRPPHIDTATDQPPTLRTRASSPAKKGETEFR